MCAAITFRIESLRNERDRAALFDVGTLLALTRGSQRCLEVAARLFQAIP